MSKRFLSSYTAVPMERVFYLDILLAWEKAPGAGGPTLATVQDAVFPPETSQADPSGPDYCRWLKTQRRLSWAREGVCVCLSSSLLSCVKNTSGLHIRLIWALFISVLCQGSTKREFAPCFSCFTSKIALALSPVCTRNFGMLAKSMGEKKKKEKKALKCISFFG